MILLDSHAVLWAVIDEQRLGTRARQSIRAEGAMVSSITYVEFGIKALINKVGLPPGFPELVAAQGIRPLPFNESHAGGLEAFPSLLRHDPFDRMLLAQAYVDGLRFLTADQTLLALDQPWIIDATR